MQSPSAGVDIARVHTHVYDDDGDGTGRGWLKELQVGTSGDPDQDHLAAYSHDEYTGRLDTVAHKGTESFAYDYLAKSHLVEKITGPNLGADAFTVTNSHEAYRDLRVRVRSEKGTTGLVDYQYKYNEIGQRYNYIEDGSLIGNGSSDGSWIIGYNDKGEVVRADRSHKEFFDQTTGITDEFDYVYDPIGNRVSADWNRFSYDDHHWTYWNASSGTDPEDEAGDDVNQYRRIDYQINAGTPVQAARVHDADGNLLEDGAKRYVWDAENRLVEVYDNNGTNGNHTDDVLMAEYRYDYMGRRVWKKTTSATAIPAEGRDVERIFVYCGWNLCAEYNATTTAGVSSIDSVKRTYTWGLDLSGSLQGAGGVGGLLAMEDHGESMVLFPLYDANGNVVAMIDEAGAREAWYLRRPFGAHWWGLGDYLNENPFRFSTKYFDLETGLYYYGYRYYDPVTGRWASRDPVGERGGLNLLGFCFNNSIGLTDYLGLNVRCQVIFLIGHNKSAARAMQELRAGGGVDCAYFGAYGCSLEPFDHGDLNADLRANGLFMNGDDDRTIPNLTDQPQLGTHVEKPGGGGGLGERKHSDKVKQEGHFERPDWVNPADWEKMEGWEQFRTNVEDFLKKSKLAADELCNCQCKCQSVTIRFIFLKDSPFDRGDFLDDMGKGKDGFKNGWVTKHASKEKSNIKEGVNELHWTYPCH